VGTAVKLTRRAWEVAELVALGRTNKEIADRLFLSERTVEWHLEQILNKLGFTSRSQVAAWIGRSQVGSPVLAPGPRSRGNLPAHITSFVGRGADMRSLLDLVHGNRLVTVTGPGGTGKTRLAVHVARDLQPEFADGTWFCDLAPVAEVALVADAVAQALGLKRTTPDRLAAVREHLQESSALLLLDNCEHLAVASAEVARDILEACPGIRVLATSRMALGVIGEAVYRLKPLGLDDAIQLFAQRAEAAAPGFRINESAKSVSAICRRLDGVPLAIELVVPRLRVQSADELAAAVLDLSWQAKSGERHGSIRALADWSYQLLDPDKQALFRRLGVFSGWFDANDAASVAPDGMPVSVLLSSLAEQSMLVYEQTTTGARYRLLEILRSFALEELAITGELEAAQISHAERIAWLAERVDFILNPETETPRAKAMSMMDDVRAALGTLLVVNPKRAALLCASMTPTWVWTGRALEALNWSDRTLAANPDPSPERCRSLFVRSCLLARLGRYEEARSSLAEAEGLAEMLENIASRAHVMVLRAACRDALREPEIAIRIRQAAIEAFSQTGDEHELARALNDTAMSMLSSGRAAEARDFAQRAIEILRRVNSARLISTIDTLAQAYVLMDDLDKARQCWLDAMEWNRNIGWSQQLELPICCFGLALVSGLRGKKDVSLRLHYWAERFNPDAAPYDQPISPKEAELIARFEAEAGPETVASLRAQAETLTPEEALELAKAEV